MASSRERWIVQICPCHFGHHIQQMLIIMKSVQKQCSFSPTTLEKGPKWIRIWGMRVTLKLSPNIALFKKVFRYQIRNFLKNYNVKNISFYFCWYKGSIPIFNVNRRLTKDQFELIHGNFSNWFGKFESIRGNFSNLFGEFKLIHGKRSQNGSKFDLLDLEKGLVMI